MGKAGGALSAVCSRTLPLLLRREGKGGLDEEEGRSEYWAGGMLPSPSQVEEPLLASRLTLLRLLGVCGSRSPASALLSLNALSRSTLSLHWFSISFRALQSARSVSVFGVQAAGSFVALWWWIWLRASRHDRRASGSLFCPRQSRYLPNHAHARHTCDSK